MVSSRHTDDTELEGLLCGYWAGKVGSSNFVRKCHGIFLQRWCFQHKDTAMCRSDSWPSLIRGAAQSQLHDKKQCHASHQPTLGERSQQSLCNLHVYTLRHDSELFSFNVCNYGAGFAVNFSNTQVQYLSLPSFSLYRWVSIAPLSQVTENKLEIVNFSRVNLSETKLFFY